MARTTTLTDDLDGTPNAAERRFTIGGTAYAIDLTDENYQTFLSLIEPYRQVARVAKHTRTNNAPILSKEDRIKIREWANSTGRKLAARGRFPNALVQEYYAEQEKLEKQAFAELQTPAMASA